MKFHTRIPDTIKEAYDSELEMYREAFTKGNLLHAWNHLERMHILGQAYPLEHSRSHWLMLRFGFAIKDWHEILGQIPRLLVGGVKSFIGHIPVGNTGGANVPPLRPMPIPADLDGILKR